MIRIFLIFILFPSLLNGQNFQFQADSISWVSAQDSQLLADSFIQVNKYPKTTEGVKFSYNQLIASGVLIALGVYGTIDGHDAAPWNGRSYVDDILPAVIPASVYVLNWSGIRGKHNFVDRTVILGTAAAISMGSCYLLKSTINTPRPDGSDNNAFPSMHTTTAFVGAEFMRQEFKGQSTWYGIAGYGLATVTGLLRIYENRHWMSDVLVGAGIGILGTKAAYWLYPKMRKWYEGTKLDHAIVVPYASGDGFGLCLSATF